MTALHLHLPPAAADATPAALAGALTERSVPVDPHVLYGADHMWLAGPAAAEEAFTVFRDFALARTAAA